MGNALTKSKCNPLNCDTGGCCGETSDSYDSDNENRVTPGGPLLNSKIANKIMKATPKPNSSNENSRFSVATKEFLNDYGSETDDDDDLIHDNNYNNDKILKEFESSIINKDFINGMAIMDEYKNINFFDYYFKNGDTCMHYAVRLHKGKFLYFLLQKGMNLCDIYSSY